MLFLLRSLVATVSGFAGLWQNSGIAAGDR
jgi:uncharacterized membrane protein YtjA (UPF0391 family)